MISFFFVCEIEFPTVYKNKGWSKLLATNQSSLFSISYTEFR